MLHNHRAQQLPSLKYYPLPEISGRFVRTQEYIFLFETGLPNGTDSRSYIFSDPSDILVIRNARDIYKVFSKIQSCAKHYYIAGYISYELGYCLEKFSAPYRMYPLLHMGVFKKAVVFDHTKGTFEGDAGEMFGSSDREDTFGITRMRCGIREKEYITKIRKLKEYIRSGDTYQVNFTHKYYFDFRGCELALYKRLKNAQPVSYAAFCKLGDEHIISMSPELFFRRDNSSITCKPMKGTMRRGRTAEEDIIMAKRLRDSSKDRAENIMIVDLIRNDLGRICKTGSVRVNSLYDIETYPTLHQMTSTVSGTLKNGTTYLDIIKSIFPGGSVTGAPKIRTMQIIREMETEPRHIYCGALGIIFPGKKAIFNLPIRTLSICKGKGEMGVGSGIVADSDARSEFRECVIKTKFLESIQSTFSLIETLRWERKYVFLKEHIQRMLNSARHFGIRADVSALELALDELAAGFERSRAYRVRLLLRQNGSVAAEKTLLNEDKFAGKKVAISDVRTDPGDIFFYHKTTRRTLYDREYRRHRERGYCEVIFLNKHNEVTEGAISNIIIKKNSRLYTPPVCAGLLAGIYRNFMLRRKGVQEKKLTLRDLYASQQIFICNSVRGLTEVEIDYTKKI